MESQQGALNAMAGSSGIQGTLTYNETVATYAGMQIYSLWRGGYNNDGSQRTHFVNAIPGSEGRFFNVWGGRHGTLGDSHQCIN